MEKALFVEENVAQKFAIVRVLLFPLIYKQATLCWAAIRS